MKLEWGSQLIQRELNSDCECFRKHRESCESNWMNGNSIDNVPTLIPFVINVDITHWRGSGSNQKNAKSHNNGDHQSLMNWWLSNWIDAVCCKNKSWSVADRWWDHHLVLKPLHNIDDMYHIFRNTHRSFLQFAVESCCINRVYVTVYEDYDSLCDLWTWSDRWFGSVTCYHSGCIDGKNVPLACVNLYVVSW